MVALLVGPAACGSGEEGTAEITAGSEFGAAPTISTEGEAPSDLQFSVLAEGDGEALETGDMLVADFKGQPWDAEGDDDGVDSTFGAAPLLKPLGKGQVPPGWEAKLPGVKVGSRVMLVEAAAESSAASGRTYVFVIDVLGAVDPNGGAVGEAVTPAGKDLPKVTGEDDPKVEIPDASPPEDLVSEVLLRGDGPEVEVDQLAVVQYTGVLWRNGEQFDSSWDREGGPSPLSFTVGKPGIITGWNEGLVGRTVGSRVLLVVPPEKGYGASGQPAAGIKGDDTMVFVVDILGAF